VRNAGGRLKTACGWEAAAGESRLAASFSSRHGPDNKPDHDD
jgi:hypothetical protein